MLGAEGLSPQLIQLREVGERRYLIVIGANSFDEAASKLKAWE